MGLLQGSHCAGLWKFGPLHRLLNVLDKMDCGHEWMRPKHLALWGSRPICRARQLSKSTIIKNLSFASVGNTVPSEWIVIVISRFRHHPAKAKSQDPAFHYRCSLKTEAVGRHKASSGSRSRSNGQADGYSDGCTADALDLCCKASLQIFNVALPTE